MFTFYQNFQARREEAELQREAESTGHDRFCQTRPGATARRKRRANLANRRAHSAIEIECNQDAFASVRSVLLRKDNKSASVEDDETVCSIGNASAGSGSAAGCTAIYGNGSAAATALQAQQQDAEESKGYYQITSKIDSLAKILFNRVYAVKGYKEPDAAKKDNRQNHQYMALDGRGRQQPGSNGVGPGHLYQGESCGLAESEAASSSAGECMEMERRSRDRALSICRIYTRETPRYSLLKHLNNVGSRVDKHWFAVRDNLLKTDRLLTLAPINRNCSIQISPASRDVLNRLFLTLQHPYICPVLDLEFVQHDGQDYVILVQPINQGSLKDIIYGIERNCWNEDWSHKYGSRGKGLPITQIQRMGRQVLEALVFLKERDFPTVSHLHSGNVVVQQGVARLAALENSLLGFTSRVHPVVAGKLLSGRSLLVPESIDTVCFGHMLFEMSAGYELCTFEPTPDNLASINKYPQVLECLRFIFERSPKPNQSKYPSIEELILHDLFRNIDLRELRNSSVNIFRPDATIPISKVLEGIKKPPITIKREANVDCEDMISLSIPENESSENQNGSLLAQIYKELSITSV
ncbi:slowpoke-binding protein isoform X1 [Trichogramma pretiosum]|uniref:slowpoke-binding protein isoform X1 n=1 Tax=Trichogramma pretiosum TaxID=7493 RepID=UPI0006C9E0CE|nr:slowpoke-binding protein isoform X1 [Trichogramma pretiosum]XP_014223547.1 slowpoke-binding protein isoform X1 [Trichogramma pretiosum]XP_014223548.1 slowpoke-binding protein isoform X1 [Trichogramma pretiosum]